jgi:co-chaperonin GroES (HSP10)
MTPDAYAYTTIMSANIDRFRFLSFSFRGLSTPNNQTTMMTFHRWITLVSVVVTTTITLHSSTTLALSSRPKPKYYGGAGVGRLNLEDLSSQKVACHYDMVLVERIQGRPKTESGLFVPQEDLPKLHLCKGTFVGVTEHKRHTQSNSQFNVFKTVYIHPSIHTQHLHIFHYSCFSRARSRRREWHDCSHARNLDW